MQRVLQNAWKKNKLVFTPSLIHLLHPDVWKKFNAEQEPITIELAKAGDINGLEAVWKKDPALFAADNIDVSPLITAVMLNRVETVKWLISKGCQFASAAHSQAFLRTETLTDTQRKEAINLGDKADLLPIDYAVASGDLNEVQLWLQQMYSEKVDINFYKLLGLAIINGHTHLFPIIVPKVDVNKILRKVHMFVDLFTQENDKNNELINAVLELISVEYRRELAVHLIFHLACNDRKKAALSLLRKLKSTESMEAREIVLGTLIGCIVGKIEEAGRNRDAEENVYPAIYVVAKGFSEEFSANTTVAQVTFLKFAEFGFEVSAFYFLEQLPSVVTRKVVNMEIDGVPLMPFLKEKIALSPSGIYKLLFLGAKVSAENTAPSDRYAFQPYFNNFFAFKKLMAEFFENKKFDQSEFEEKIGKLKDPVKCGNEMELHHRKHYANECLNEFFRLLWEKINDKTEKPLDKSFLEKVYFILQGLTPEDLSDADDYSLLQRVSAKLACLLGKNEQAVAHLEKLESNLIKNNRQNQSIARLIGFLSALTNKNVEDIAIDKNPLILLQTYYSKLMLMVGGALKLKSNLPLELFLDDTAQPTILIGEDVLLSSASKTYTAEDFDHLTDEISKRLIATENYKKENKEELNKDETRRILLAINHGYFLLNGLLKQIEEKLLKSLLSGHTDINKLKLNDNNQPKVEALERLYVCILKIHDYLCTLDGIQRNFLSHPDLPELNINHTKKYANDIKKFTENNLFVKAVLCGHEQKTKSIKTKPPTQSAGPKKEIEEERDEKNKDNVVPEQTGLPTYHYSLGRSLVQTALPFRPTASTTVKTTFFYTPAKVVTPETPEDKKVRELKQIGYNQLLPVTLLHFLIKFKPGQIFIVGSCVNYALGHMDTFPEDCDLMTDMSFYELKQLLSDSAGVFDLEKIGLGKDKSYALNFKLKPTDKPLKIDITRLAEAGANLEVRLEKNSSKRDMTAKAMILDPFSSAKNQLFDFHNGKSDSSQHLIVMMKQKLSNPFDEFPKRILRALDMEIAGWRLPKKDEHNFINSIKYLERLSVDQIMKAIIKIYQKRGTVKAESLFVKYKLEEIANVKVALEEVKKHPELYARQHSAVLVEDTFASKQREFKMSS